MSRYGRSRSHDYYGFAPYVSVARKKINAAKLAKKLEKNGATLEPVSIEGKQLTTTFWGKSWNENLERYRDFENRLPRGRSYLRHGAVIDLKVKDGVIEAQVSGSSLYQVTITIKPLKKSRWTALKRECSGKITSLVGLLQGKLPAPVMAAVTHQDSGLFPEPKDIKFDCSCPDYAGICKHCAAAVYGVGARLDHKPELLFLLRGVDHTELITGAGDAVLAQAGEDQGGVALDDIGGIFGIELDTTSAGQSTPAKRTKSAKAPVPEPSPKNAAKKVAKKAAGRKTEANKTIVKTTGKVVKRAVISSASETKNGKPRQRLLERNHSSPIHS